MGKRELNRGKGEILPLQSYAFYVIHSKSYMCYQLYVYVCVLGLSVRLALGRQMPQLGDLGVLGVNVLHSVGRRCGSAMCCSALIMNRLRRCRGGWWELGAVVMGLAGPGDGREDCVTHTDPTYKRDEITPAAAAELRDTLSNLVASLHWP